MKKTKETYISNIQFDHDYQNIRTNASINLSSKRLEACAQPKTLVYNYMRAKNSSLIHYHS